MYTVYRTTNLVNGKFYIGVHKTNDPNDRYLGSGDIFRRARRKYGGHNFKKEILCIFDNAELAYFVEEHYVTQKEVDDPMCYNKSPGGMGGKSRIVSAETRERLRVAQLGKRHSEETKILLSERGTKRVVSDETKNKISLIHCGRHFSAQSIERMRIAATNRSDSTREKLRIAHTGKRHSQETKDKISATMRARKAS